MKSFFIFSMAIAASCIHLEAQEDPYIWLEEVDGAKALDFVNKQNTATVEKLSNVKEYQSIYNRTLEILNSTDKIAYPTIYGQYIYNFWKDKDHVRGIWRRSSLRDYVKGKPVWETLLDIDKMSADDNEKWVYKGATGLFPNYDRFLISLSKGGGDAVVIREYDAKNKSFIKDGFVIPESKGGANYVDENTLLVSSDFGDNTMTTSGYPRQVKLWKRGTMLKDATLIYEGAASDVGTWGGTMRDGGENHIVISQAMTFYTSHTIVWHNNQAIKLDIPEDSDVKGILKNQLILHLKSDWMVNDVTYKQGSLVSLAFAELLDGKKNVQLIVEPDAYSSVTSVSNTKNKLLVNMLTNVSSELNIYNLVYDQWKKEKVDTPSFGNVSVQATDELSDTYFFNFANFLTPSTLYLANANDNTCLPFKSLPAYFDGNKYEVNQYKSKSKDGTLIPYFVVSPKGMSLDSKQPTLLYAYGGFESSSLPFYSGGIGTSWLENGGVFVLANIRGGGEFGPKWHQAGLKEKRQNVYDDFHSVAEDLIAKNITSPEHLGIMGGSNGGLLVGVAFTQRPELYNAVVCQVPLLDMQRYNKLLAGASWMGEYGNPDIPEEWAYIQKYSPYHNLKNDITYPEVFFYTSTRDDRVHPGHARKMVAKMTDMGHPVYYYENTEGGHAGASTNEQSAKMNAMTFSYLLQKLKK